MIFRKSGTTRNTSQYTFNLNKTIMIHYKYISKFVCFKNQKLFSSAPVHKGISVDVGIVHHVFVFANVKKNV